MVAAPSMSRVTVLVSSVECVYGGLVLCLPLACHVVSTCWNTLMIYSTKPKGLRGQDSISHNFQAGVSLQKL